MRQVVEALKDGTKVAPTATGSVRLKGGLKEVPEPPAFSGRTIQTTEEFIVSGEGMTSKFRKNSTDSQVLRQRRRAVTPRSGSS